MPKFRKLECQRTTIVEGTFSVYETARYGCFNGGVILKGEQNIMNQSHNVMWFHSRDNFSKKYKTRNDALINGRGLYDC